MEWSQDAIRSLRETLARFYPVAADAMRVVSDAKLDITRVAIDAKAINTWFNILEYAKNRKGGIDAILAVALADYPDAQGLLLAKEQAPPPILQGPDTTDWFGPSGKSVLEKIIGIQNTLVPISYFEAGLNRSRSVLQIVRADGSAGTGFLTRGDIVLTNNHVLPTAEIAQSAVARFNYQQTCEGLNAPIDEYQFVPAQMFKTSASDDWTAVKLDRNPSTKWGTIELKPVRAMIGNYANIIQHSGGGPKQVSFAANLIVYVGDGRIQYLTDTLPGSSGAPVFDTAWNLIAIHHSGGWIAEPNAPGKSTYYRNEGILAERLMAGLSS
jgi:V8-like Glu-specific endopeptidase